MNNYFENHTIAAANPAASSSIEMFTDEQEAMQT